MPGCCLKPPWYKGNFFKEWIGGLLKKKTGSSNITFKALREHSGKELYVYASNISTNFGEVYSPEHTPRMRVVDAVRRSMSIPLFFRAVRDDREDVFVDGGVINNYPVKLFDRDKYLSDPSLTRIPPYYENENKKMLLDLHATKPSATTKPSPSTSLARKPLGSAWIRKKKLPYFVTDRNRRAMRSSILWITRWN